MSYLRQLTQQAGGQRLLGQPRPLRAPETMRWSTASADAGIDTAGIDTPAEEPERRKPRSDHRAVPGATPERLLEPEPRAAASPAAAESPAPIQVARGQPETAPDPTTARAAAETATPSPAARLESLETLLPAILNPRRTTPEVAAIESAEQQATAARRHGPDHPDPAPEPHGEANVPLRKQPPQAATPQRTRQAEPPATSASAPAVPDVHIHIGRVELTALQPPAPRPAPRREEKKPMSLEDYLRQRDGRRS